MQLHKETQRLINELLLRWEEVKNSYILKKDEYGSEREMKIGEIWWDNPNVIWVLVTGNDEGYEGSQTQVGLTKDGRLLWEYQSHCSCNYYEDSSEIEAEFLTAIQDTKKSYELGSIPLDWETKIAENIKQLLS